MKSKLVSKANVFAISFLVFAGYFVFLALILFFGSESLTRFFTIPIRIFVVFLIFAQAFFIGLRKKVFSYEACLFYLFSLLYLARIFWEMLNGHNSFHRPTIEFLLYYGSFCIFPFLFFVQVKEYKTVFWAIFSSSLIFSALSYFLYGSLLGQSFGRITTQAARESVGFDVISPLSLSYCASFLLGISFFKLFLTEEKIKNRKLYYFAIVLGIIPFFLGSSRGSFIALIFSIFFVLFFRKGYKVTLKAILYSAVGFIILFFGANLVGSNIFNRLLGISNAITLNSSSAERLIWWEKGFYQFLNHPIFGNSLEATFAHFYPHNLFIETMITMGIPGFLLFFAMITIGFVKSINIIRTVPSLGWISLLFIQAFTQNMFSGAIYNSIWLWSILALVFSINIKKLSTPNYSNKIQI